MMNQKVVIYIILSAILLYLYYKRGGVALFVAFIVVVAGTLFAGTSASASEGFGLGGGKGGDKQCVKLGFKEVKLDKDEVADGLENVMKDIEKVTEKEWPFEKGDYEGKRSNDETFKKNWNIIIDSSELQDALKKGKDNPDMGAGLSIYSATTEIYETFLNTTTTPNTKTTVIAKYNTSELDKLIKSGSRTIQFIERLKKSDDIKEGGAKVQKIMTYIMCLVKHWISIFKAMRKVSGSGKDDDDAGDGENKKKKTTKKKDNEGDAGDAGDGGDGDKGGDGGEEKPKKKKKKVTKKTTSNNEE